MAHCFQVMEKVENQFMVDTLKVRPGILCFFCFSSDVKQVWSHTLMRRGLLVVHVLHETNAAWKYFICMSLGINFIVIYNF